MLSYWPRGKVLGGCTSINGMIYHHGSPSDFDEWEKLGATGWSYHDMAPYVFILFATAQDLDKKIHTGTFVRRKSLRHILNIPGSTSKIVVTMDHGKPPLATKTP
jgi:choline dehydrogenase-like flavoprotein